MAIAAADIEWRYSGGSGNTNPNACLGGAISTSGSGVIDDNVLNDLFDNVNGTEAASGETEYRGIYIKNNHGSLTLADARIWIQSNTTSANDTFEIALADEAVTTTIETIADENTAPVGPSFSTPANYAGGLALNSTTGLVAGAYKGVWIRRVVSASAASITANSCALRVQGDTPP